MMIHDCRLIYYIRFSGPFLKHSNVLPAGFDKQYLQAQTVNQIKLRKPLQGISEAYYENLKCFYIALGF
jgi:hypothetical protein